MERHAHVKFVRQATPDRIEKREDGRLVVHYTQNGEEVSDEFDTVLFAIGRDACTSTMGLDKAGVQLNERSVFFLIFPAS